MTPRRQRAAGALLGIVLLLSACGGSAEEPGGDSAARPLTTEEAQRLARVRFANFDAGTRAVTARVTDAGVGYEVDAWVDFQAGLGYGHLENTGGEAALIAWSSSAVSSYAGPAAQPAPLPPPGTEDGAGSWTSSALDPAASRLHALLAVVLESGSDRPDNPLLLQQTDARWLRSETVDGVEVDVISGPTADEAHVPGTSAGDGSDSPVRYWVDDDGVLQRLEVRLGGGGEWTSVDLAPADGVEFADAFLEAS